MTSRAAILLSTSLAPADLRQHLSGYHRIPAAEPPVYRCADTCVARRASAVGVDAADTQTQRMGDRCLARFFEHRLFPSQAVCGGVPPAGRTGGGAEFDADADGAGVHLVNRQNHAAESGLGLGSSGCGGDGVGRVFVEIPTHFAACIGVYRLAVVYRQLVFTACRPFGRTAA